MNNQIAIFGAGGLAPGIAWLAELCSQPDRLNQVVCYIDDDAALQGTLLDGLPVMSLEAARSNFPHARVIGGVGSPAARERLIGRAAAAGFGFETLIHPRTEMPPGLEIGPGAVIYAGSILSVHVRLGAHVQISFDCTVGHNSILGDYCTLAPGVHVAGYVTVGKRVWVGTGATIINGVKGKPLVIGDDAVIGAGACVTKPVPRGVTVVGVPARPILR